uniref:Secreted protein n=1 Tax=Macrostomum lignano TaxID=282301 RepID=A0A1I8G0J4_9PLAT
MAIETTAVLPLLLLLSGPLASLAVHFELGLPDLIATKRTKDGEVTIKGYRATTNEALLATNSQVRHLLLSKLTCVMDLRDTDRRSVKITGAPSRLDRFPLKVEFKSPPGSESRSLFEKRLIDDPDMSVPCSICLSSLSIDA